MFAAACVLCAPAYGGSTGGAIGKKDKSVSGDVSAPQVSKPPVDRDDQPKGISASSLAGSWNWDASCTGKQWNGEMTLRASSSSDFAGEFSKLGTVKGSVKGSRISFTRDWSGLLHQEFNGTVSQSPRGTLRMNTRVIYAGHTNCRFSATKK
jgi:hypothetical protein